MRVCCLQTLGAPLTFEPVSNIRYKLACAPIKESDHPEHLHSMISPFILLLCTLCGVPGRIAQSITCLATGACLTADPALGV